MRIDHPYLLFLGDAPDDLAAKTAAGIAQWRPEWCLGQLTLSGCRTTLGLPELSIEDAAKAGAKTLVCGVANRGGVIGQAWIDVFVRALQAGMDVAAGLHERLIDIPTLAQTADMHGRRLHDVRHPQGRYPVASGALRPGHRLLTVGTDCSVGKMYTALALEREMRARGMKADFRATGQTGILIAGDGVSVDAVVADFIAGAAETIAPANDPDHWDLVEGQGSLFHASYAGVSLGLLHGAQPDALVLCHEPERPHMRGIPHHSLPSLEACMEANLSAARVSAPRTRFVGVAFNTRHLKAGAAADLMAATAERLGLPCVDPVRTGVGPIVDRLRADFGEDA